LLDLPLELILEIISYLPPASQACFALTCKPLYNCFSYVLKDEALCFPRLLNNLNPLISLNQKHVARNQFLLLLQNRRWKYCAACLKLHPRKEFPRGLRSLTPSITRKCAPFAGILDLCACTSLTPRGMERLVRSLQGAICERDQRYPILGAEPDGRYQFSRDDQGNRTLTHTCSTPRQSKIACRLEMTISADGADSLVVRTYYHYRFRKTPTVAIWCKKIPTCPHRDL
ncbi:hypothetical protein BP00DRAFT_302028, partial [Aspergillus indologenus CBS 114.80]